MSENVLDKEERLDEVPVERLDPADLTFLLNRCLPSYEDSGFSGHQRMAGLVRELMRRYIASPTA